MATSADVRSQLIDALRLDLVGPRPDEVGHEAYAEEVLPVAPSKWYLTGFLVPYEAPLEQRSDDDGDDVLDQMDRPVEADDDNAPEAASARKAFFPSSMGLSMLVPRGAMQLQVKVAWADYAPVVEDDRGEEKSAEQDDAEAMSDRRRPRGWRRLPREAELTLTLQEGEPVSMAVPGGEGLWISLQTSPG